MMSLPQETINKHAFQRNTHYLKIFSHQIARINQSNFVIEQKKFREQNTVINYTVVDYVIIIFPALNLM